MSLWQLNSFDMQCMQLNCAALPYDNQERLIIRELLYSFIGMRGTFIHLDQSAAHLVAASQLRPLRYVVSEQVNISLRQMATELLPMATHYSLVQQFVSLHNCVTGSQVLQALSAALRVHLQDYHTVVCQLESELDAGSLNIHKLKHCLEPVRAAMETLAHTVVDIVKNDMRGAQVLSLLHGKIVSLLGNDQAQELLIDLTERAAVPYFSVLERWMLKGVIYDPSNEFMIEDNEVIRREEIETNHYAASYWEKRYNVRRECVPRFLNKYSDIILRTGKYLNVIRQCGDASGNSVNAPAAEVAEGLRFSAQNEAVHMDLIKKAYRRASRTLLELLITEKDLMGHLTSVKRYLLMHQGDFITEFMDASDEELSKNVNHILPMKLDNLLGLTLRISSAKHDCYKDNLICNLIPTDVVKMMSEIHLVSGTSASVPTAAAATATTTAAPPSEENLTGFDCFAFRYEIQWPVSLILNSLAESQYQMLFRLLFNCKHVERQLYKSWTLCSHKAIIKFETRHAETLRFIFSLRQRMIYAIQNLEYYMMIEVIEPMWHEFLQKMERVENVDDVLVAHQDFIDRCLENCMLKTPDLLGIVMGMCKVCLSFCALAKNAMQLKPTDECVREVRKYDTEFSVLLMRLLVRVKNLSYENSNGKFINLVHRINFNGFYTAALEAQNSLEIAAAST